jgi:uncharacterized membrane protein
MSRRVFEFQDPVETAADDLPLMHNDGAERTPGILAHAFEGKPDGLPHEILVAHEVGFKRRQDSQFCYLDRKRKTDRMAPFFTNDASILGVLIVVLALIFYTAGSEIPFWKKFYTYVPPLLLCYFVPALLYWPLGLIAPAWYDDGLIAFLQERGLEQEGLTTAARIESFLQANGIALSEVKAFKHSSQLYFVASRYLLPASLILLTLSIDFKGLINLGPKALIMFFAATFGIVFGGPLALWVVLNYFPDIIPASPEEVWRGLSTVAGSWIGGGANQTAMKEIFEVPDNLFATMIVVDVVVANIWMGFLLYGANISQQVDRWLKADNSAIEDLKERVKDFQARVARIPTTTEVFIMLAIAFGGTGLAHWGSDRILPLLEGVREALTSAGLNSLLSGFFWLIVISTTLGLVLAFTRFRNLEGIGASRWGSVFIYILVATIGMKMNLAEVWQNLGLFAVGLIWMLVHVSVLLLVAWWIKAPFFFVAVGSQANVGGAASAPVVASAFSPSLAPVGVLMAVLGYALGTYGALLCAFLMQWVAGG